MATQKCSKCKKRKADVNVWIFGKKKMYCLVCASGEKIKQDRIKEQLGKLKSRELKDKESRASLKFSNEVKT